MMYVLSLPKDICFWDCEQKVYITKENINKKEWILLRTYLDHNVYYEYEPKENGCIYPEFFFGFDYIKKFIEERLNIQKPYPKDMLQYIKENNIILPKHFDFKQ